jgi:glucose-6-phosphate 1-dehydrogenase
LFHLARSGLLPKHYRIIGSSPKAYAMPEDKFREHAKDAVQEFGLAKPTGDAWMEFESSLTFGIADPGAADDLLAKVATAEKELGGNARRLYHLAVPPVAFSSMIGMLGDTGMAEGAHVIVEKPFGTDLASARALNTTIHRVFDESQIFRIDHFLGKESVDNVLALRFANGLFEPIWNRDHVEHVIIDVPESISIEGRAEFFEKTGTFRDMIVTHLFQVMGFIAMEPPTAFAAKQLRDEKAKVFEAIKPIDPKDVVRGQYVGYRESPGVDPKSDTETFIALKVEVDNWRWAGVPFFLRSGKSLAQRRNCVTLAFRKPAVQMFPDDARQRAQDRGNELVIDCDDPGWISARFLAKEPGPGMRLSETEMLFEYDTSFHTMHELEGYERLILEAMLGDQTLFTRADGIERLWEVGTPLLENPLAVEMYEPGSWGPDSIKKLIRPHHWYLPDGKPSA